MAPQVPYSGIPQVALQENATPRLGVNTPPAAFGVDVADATQHLGQAVSGAGNEIFARGVAMQDLYNHSAASEAAANYQEAAGKLHADFSALQGKDAVDAFPQYIQNLKDTRAQMQAALPNDMARKMFEAESLSFQGRTIFNGAGYAASQNKQYAIGAAAARVQSARNAALTNPTDEDAFQDHVQDTEDNVAAQYSLKGADPDTIANAQHNAISALWVDRITGLAKSQPFTAGKMLDDALKQGVINGEDIGPLTAKVNSARDTVGARQVANTISTGANNRWGAGQVDIAQAREAIGQIESGGRYNLIGVQTAHGRALGKYQVMEEFLPDYLQRAGLPSMTPAEFLANHSAQDQVFAANFGAYMKQTGSANDAASMWLTGKPLAQAGNVKDALGTNAATYVANFNRALAKNAPLAAKVDMGRSIASEQAPDDPTFGDYVTQRIEADHNQALRVERDDQFQARQTVESALMGGQTGGKLPTTLEELRQDPQASDAFDRLQPSVQRRYLGVLANNAKGDHNWTDATLRQYQQIKGLAQTEPAEFIDQDVVGTNLPNSAKRELINLQARLKGQAQGDPRVARALAILAPDMQAAGIDKKNRDDYLQFTGALSDQLQEFSTENKRPPKIDEIKTIGSRLMQSQKTPGFLWGTNDTPTYHVPVPNDEADKIKADPEWTRLGITPTDQQIQRIYTRKLYQDLYGGKVKAQASAAPAPQAPVSQ